MTTAQHISWNVSHTCEGGACIAVSKQGESVLLRLTGSPEGTTLRASTGEWEAFVEGIRQGDFDNI
jgi:predicted secreted Zn-dependent protease